MRLHVQKWSWWVWPKITRGRMSYTLDIGPLSITIWKNL